MRKILLSMVSVAALALVSLSASADTSVLKVGVIDLQQIIQKAPQVATINAQLNKQFKPRQDKILSTQKDLQAETDKLERNSATMSVTDRNKLQDQVMADRSSMQEMVVAFQRDLTAAQNQGMQSFMTQLNTVINSIAKVGNYNLILQRAAAPYADSGLDITSQVLQALNKK
jgi:outer membrane protein